jgi:hypothetical protein
VLALVDRNQQHSRTEKAGIAEKRNTLRRQIEKFIDAQHSYMPGVVALRGNLSALKDERPELIQLWLPSAIPDETRSEMCLPGIIDIYLQYRQAQIHDSLVQLRQTRRVVRGLNEKYRVNLAAASQRAITRSRTTIANANRRVDRVARRYCAARKALCSLNLGDSWKEKYRELNLKTDLTGPGKEYYEARTGEGYYVPSWIWLIVLGSTFQDSIFAPANDESAIDPAVSADISAPPAAHPDTTNLSASAPRTSSNPPAVPSTLNKKGKPLSKKAAEDTQKAKEADQINQALRVEWCRLSARADRWDEEVSLLKEEMKRTISFLQWKAREWDARAGLRQYSVAVDFQKGLAAYAAKQAAVFHELASSFATLWHPVLLDNAVPCDWWDSDGNLRDLSSECPSPLPAPSPSQIQSPPAHASAPDSEDNEAQDDNVDDDFEDFEDEEEAGEEFEDIDFDAD